MRFLWFLPVVPRPDASFVAVQGLTLATYLVFRDLEPQVAGLTVSAFNLAVAVFIFAVISRNLILNPLVTKSRTALVAGLTAALLLPGLLLAVLGEGAVRTVQAGITAWLLAYATIVLAFVAWAPGDLARLPSVWAADPRFNVAAMRLVALGYVLRGATLLALAFWSTELAWVVFLTLGWLALGFALNWVIVMMIASRLDEGD